MKSKNTLIFQTNYHTSAFNSFDMGQNFQLAPIGTVIYVWIGVQRPRKARRITPKKCADYRLEPINYRYLSIITDAGDLIYQKMIK